MQAHEGNTHIPTVGPLNTATLLWTITSVFLCEFYIVPTGRGKLEKSGNLSGQGKVRGNVFPGKSWIFVSEGYLISAGAPPQTLLGELTVLPQIP